MALADAVSHLFINVRIVCCSVDVDKFMKKIRIKKTIYKRKKIVMSESNQDSQSIIQQSIQNDSPVFIESSQKEETKIQQQTAQIVPEVKDERTNLQKFYDEAMDGTNVITCDNLRE